MSGRVQVREYLYPIFYIKKSSLFAGFICKFKVYYLSLGKIRLLKLPMRLAFLLLLCIFYLQPTHGEGDNELLRKKEALDRAFFELKVNPLTERILPLSDSIIREAKKIGYADRVVNAYQVRCQYICENSKLTDEQNVLEEVEEYMDYAQKNNIIDHCFIGWETLIYYYIKNESFKAVSEIEDYRSEAIRRKLPKYIARSYRFLGELSLKQEEVYKAIDNFRKGAESSDSINDWRNASYCYSQIGRCLMTLHDYKGAIKAWDESIKRYKGIVSKINIPGDRICQAIAYYYLKNYDKMRAIYKSVEKIDFTNSFTQTRKMMLHSYIALADKEYSKSLAIADSIKEDLMRYVVKDHIYFETRNYKDGLKNLTNILNLDVARYKKIKKDDNEAQKAQSTIINLQNHMKQMDFKSSQVKMEKELLYYSILKDEQQKHLIERNIEIQNADMKVKKMIKKNLIENERHKSLMISLDSQYKRNKALIVQNIIVISFAFCVIVSFIIYGLQRRKYIRQLKNEEEETERLRNEAALLHKKAEDDRAIAEDANNIKSKFLHTVSNRVRIPLNTVVNFANMLINNESANAIDKKKYMAIIQHSSSRLSIFISNVLDYSNLTSGKYQMNITRCTIGDICKNAIKETYDNKLPIITEISSKIAESTLMTDESRVIRVISYLIDNIFVYTQKGVIRLNCSLTEDEAVFIISNDDITISQEQINAINRYLTRADGGAENDMSLHLCHVIAAKLQGTCYLETEGKRGTRFVFKHPCIKSQNLLTDND